MVFKWGGLVLLLAVLGLGGPSMATRIESRIETQSRAALDDAGFAAVEVQVDGRDVRLSGPEGVRAAAAEVLRALRVSTWLGTAVPIADLSYPPPVSELGDGHASVDAPVPDLAPTEPESVAPSETAEAVVWNELEMRLRNGELLLTGSVASEAEAQELRQRAEAKINAPRLRIVRSELTPATGRSTPVVLFERALDGLSMCYFGHARVRAGVLDLDCVAQDELVPGIHSLVTQPPPEAGTFGKLSIRGATAVATQSEHH